MKRSTFHNLPAPLTGLVGREQALAELEALVGEYRSVTLTGAPGVGKSRLALEVARSLAEDYAGGAWLVELAPLDDGALLAAAVATALSVGEVPGRSYADGVVASVGERRALVVLDNCEHLIGACAELVDLLLARCPDLRIIATSREALQVAGETVWPVPTLATPAQDEEPAGEALMDYAAVRLFVERAAGVEPGFALNGYVAPAVAEICRRLDGIPLAIELAAARVGLLTPAEIAQRLDDRFDLLTSGSADLLPHHQTLESALDWSHELLCQAERALFRRTSVFLGGFDPESCEAVCAGSGIDGSQVVAVLGTLVAKSLVVEEHGDGSGVRYRLLETIRAFASERLEEAGEARERRELHARFYLDLAERAESDLIGPDQERWFTGLEAERANLGSALAWSLGHGRSEWALRQAGALVLFWRVRCHFSEGRDLLRAALAAGNGAAPHLRCKALWGAGFLTLMSGDPEGAVASLEESLTLARASGDLRGRARALLVLGNCHQHVGVSALALLEESAALAREAEDPWCLAHALAVAGFENDAYGELPAARALFEECLVVARDARDDQSLRFGLLGLGSVALHQGDFDAAESLLEEAVVVTGELGDDYCTAEALQRLGQLALGRGDYDQARALLEDGFALIPEAAPPETACGILVLLARLAHAEGDRARAGLLYDSLVRAGAPTPITAVLGMGDLAAEAGDLDQGRRVLEDALTRARALGHKELTATALHSLGRIARDTGESRRAATLHNEALELQHEIGAAAAIVASIEALAGLAGAAGRYQQAARLLGAAGTHRQDHGYARLPWESASYEADMALARAGLGATDFEDAFIDGGELSVEDAVALASQAGGGRARPSSGYASLTERQEQVAELAAQGLTNPEIAERLVITRATVKYHLLHIFSKLGVTSRGQLARASGRRNGAGSTGDD